MTREQPGSEADSSIRITLNGSYTGCKPRQRATLRALGLRKVRDSVVHEDSEAIRGMVDKVSHLVTVEKVD